MGAPKNGVEGSPEPMSVSPEDSSVSSIQLGIDHQFFVTGDGTKNPFTIWSIPVADSAKYSVVFNPHATPYAPFIISDNRFAVSSVSKPLDQDATHHEKELEMSSSKPEFNQKPVKARKSDIDCTTDEIEALLKEQEASEYHRAFRAMMATVSHMPSIPRAAKRAAEEQAEDHIRRLVREEVQSLGVRFAPDKDSRGTALSKISGHDQMRLRAVAQHAIQTYDSFNHHELAERAFKAIDIEMKMMRSRAKGRLSAYEAILELQNPNRPGDTKNGDGSSEHTKFTPSEAKLIEGSIGRGYPPLPPRGTNEATLYDYGLSHTL